MNYTTVIYKKAIIFVVIVVLCMSALAWHISAEEVNDEIENDVSGLAIPYRTQQ